jgi:hypothetical protein
VIFIAGNLPFKTEIAPLLITIRLEEYDYDGAIAIAALLLARPSFRCLLAINTLIPALFARKRAWMRPAAAAALVALEPHRGRDAGHRVPAGDAAGDGAGLRRSARACRCGFAALAEPMRAGA